MKNVEQSSLQYPLIMAFAIHIQPQKLNTGLRDGRGVE
jgi:hypothetical protein